MYGTQFFARGALSTVRYEFVKLFGGGETYPPDEIALVSLSPICRFLYDRYRHCFLSSPPDMIF